MKIEFRLSMMTNGKRTKQVLKAAGMELVSKHVGTSYCPQDVGFRRADSTGTSVHYGHSTCPLGSSCTHVAVVPVARRQTKDFKTQMHSAQLQNGSTLRLLAALFECFRPDMGTQLNFHPFHGIMHPSYNKYEPADGH